MKHGSSGKTLVAEADDTAAAESQNHISHALNRIEGSTLHSEPADGETTWMPHCSLDLDGLAERFPPMVAPTDGSLEDLVDDRADLIFQHGLGIAQKIADDMASRGRTRRDIGD